MQLPCLMGFLVFFFCFVFFSVVLVLCQWLMLTSDLQLRVSFLWAFSVASCFLVFMLFITSVEMLIFVSLLNYTLKLYWVLILRFLAASPLSILASFAEQLRGILTVLVICASTDCTEPRTDSHATLLNIFYTLIVKWYVKLFQSSYMCII